MRSRFPLALLIAAAAHVGLVVSIRWLPKRAGRLERSAPSTFEIEVVEAPNEPSPETATVSEPAPESLPNASTKAEPEPRRPGPRAPPGHATEQGAPPQGVEPSGDQGSWSISPWVASSGAPSWDAGAAWSLSTAPPANVPDRPPPPSGGYSQTGGLKEALAARDQELGLGSGGPVVAAAHDVVFRSDIAEGTATFDVDTDPHGRVVSVRVVDANAERGVWERVANDIAAAMRAKPLRVRNGSRGVALRVRVTVGNRLPSGARSRFSDTKVGADTRGANVSTKFDLSDIGAGRQRVVGVRIVSERAL